MGLRTPYYQVKMEGEDITPWISSVTVVEEDRQTDNVAIAIPDPRMIYTDALFEGSIVEVTLGYEDQHALMLRAIITKVELSYPENGVPSLTLKGEDRSILMGLKEKKKVWRDLKLSEIVRKISKSEADYGFKKVEVLLAFDPMIQSQPIHQDGKTDLAFLQELAEKYHAKCFVELDEQAQEVLYFVAERRLVELRRQDELVLSYRSGFNSNLMSFSPSFDSSYIDRLKEVSDIDSKGKKIATQKSQKKPLARDIIWELDKIRLAQANESDRTKIQLLYQKGKQRKQDLQEKLTTRQVTVGQVAPDQTELNATDDSLESHRLGMTANGSTVGNIWLRAKSNIVIAGVNERFNGRWYVPSVTHKIDTGGYKTDFKCVR